MYVVSPLLAPGLFLGLSAASEVKMCNGRQNHGL